VESDNPEASIAEAVAAAKKADVAILFVGINQMLEREGIDRDSLNLPPLQLKLLQSVFQANAKTAVVLLNGGPVSLAPPRFAGPGPRAMDIPAVLDMFWAGEEGGTAVADVLFGDYNPGGKLPYTVYAGERDLPPMNEYDITKGFTYMYFAGKPEYAFGHGLSYTTFDYNNLQLSSQQIASDGQVTVQVAVRNSGQRAGEEVVQLYVHDGNTNVKRPKEQLTGFERIRLQPGEAKTVSFLLPAEQLAYWDSDQGMWVVKPGEVDAMVGSGSDDIRQKAQFQITTAGQWPPGELTTRVSLGN
jgi:beta-glucosidase